MLLHCSISWCQINNSSFPSTGEATITITIDTVRIINAKLIERNYLLELCKQQDSIISLNKKYIEEQNKVIKDFQNKIIDYNRINENLQKEYERQRKRTIIISTVGGTIITGCVIGIIVGALK